MQILLTYQALGRLPALILSIAIAAYLIWRRRENSATPWLAGYFVLLTIFNSGYFFSYAVFAPFGGWGWHLACAIAFAGVFRLQFAYQFPVPGRALEARAALILSILLAMLASVDYAWRAGSDFVFGFAGQAYGSKYRSPLVPAVSLSCYIWSVTVSVRSAVAMLRQADGRTWIARIRNLWNTAPAFRLLMWLIGITIAEIAINLSYYLVYNRMLTDAALVWLMNSGILVIFCAYVLLYTSAPDSRAGLTSRLVGVSLAGSLIALSAVFGFIANQQKDELVALHKERAAQLADTSISGLGRLTAQEPVADYDDGRFAFFWRDGSPYYGLTKAITDRQPAVLYPYIEYRLRQSATAGGLAILMLGASAAILLLFPLLFRASLILPLRRLQADLRAVQAGVDRRLSGGDEISELRESFQAMLGLLQRAKDEIQDFAPHIAALQVIAEQSPRQVQIEGRTLVYRSAALRRALESAERAAQFPYPVLITGESGSGKELIARYIHLNSRPSAQTAPFVALNCATIPETLWESEIFGHRRGAFTDARSERLGRIAEAAQGSLFFDEIGELHLSIQARLLRLLQEGVYRPLGATEEHQAACRFLFATNRNLEAMVREGSFREDLLFRIRVLTIETPPLRDRPEDIGPLLEFLVDRFAAQHSLPRPAIAAETLQAAIAYPWPGNIREMENAVVRAMAGGPGAELQLSDFAELLSWRSSRGRGLWNRLDGATIQFDAEVQRFSRQLIERALALSGGNKTRAAEILGLKRTTLRYRMRELGLGGD